MENYIYNIVSSKKKQRMVGFIILALLILSIALLPTRLVLAKMLPGKSANTYTIYIDTSSNSTAMQTKEVASCVVNTLKKEKEILNMEIFLGQGAPLDYAGLVKGSAFKALKSQAEVVVNLTDKHNRDEASYAMIHRL
jgi:multidrug efflux pump subunit AcrB